MLRSWRNRKEIPTPKTEVGKTGLEKIKKKFNLKGGGGGIINWIRYLRFDLVELLIVITN